MSDPAQHENEAYDRLVERGLHEVRGGETAPDLAADILMKIQSQTADSPPEPHRDLRRWLAIAAVLLVGCGLAAWSLREVQHPEVARGPTHVADYPVSTGGESTGQKLDALSRLESDLAAGADLADVEDLAEVSKGGLPQRLAREVRPSPQPLPVELHAIKAAPTANGLPSATEAKVRHSSQLAASPPASGPEITAGNAERFEMGRRGGAPTPYNESLNWERRSKLQLGVAPPSSLSLAPATAGTDSLDLNGGPSAGSGNWRYANHDWYAKSSSAWADYDGKRYRLQTVPETKLRTENYTVMQPVQKIRKEVQTRIVEGETHKHTVEVPYTVMQPVTQSRTVSVTELQTLIVDESGKEVTTLAATDRERVRQLLERINHDLQVEGRGPEAGGDQYERIHENPFVEAKGTDAVSTFSIDVDTAAYSNVRQFLRDMGRLPPPDAVRIEEMVNYFRYNYAGPAASANDGDVAGQAAAPFAAAVEVASCPWNRQHQLVRVGIKGREVETGKRPLSNLVFLVDVSGSMNEPNKLPLVVEGLTHMTRELGENDQVAIVVYAGSEGLALPSTRGDKRAVILAALDRLSAGGSTAGGAGIQLAYRVAEESFIKGGTNRVILCTDGDFNVGVTSTADLERLAESKAKETGVFLTVLGFGRGNLNDAMMEKISNRGNGNYHYVDSLREARRVLVQQLSGTLVTIAKDVKIQVEFNPARVAGYRLIGYENRMLARQDFNDDTKDAGEIGAGHTVTALYEIAPTGSSSVRVTSDEPLKYQPPMEMEPTEPSGSPESPAEDASAEFADELLTLRLRYKPPEGDKSTKLEFAVKDADREFEAASEDFRFAASVAGFGMLLRDSQYKGDASYDSVREMASRAIGQDPHGDRTEFLDLVLKASQLAQ